MKTTNSNIENLEGIISKLKNQGINAGESEKKRILDAAKVEAEKIIADAKNKSKDLVQKAEADAKQMEKNAKTAINQASRDIIEATKIEIIHKLKTIFKLQSNELFTQEQYLQELLKLVTQMMPESRNVQVPASLAKQMQDYIIKQALNEKLQIKPLPNNEAKIILSKHDDDDLQFVLSSQDIEEALFSLVNKELIETIIKNREE